MALEELLVFYHLRKVTGKFFYPFTRGLFPRNIATLGFTDLTLVMLDVAYLLDHTNGELGCGVLEGNIREAARYGASGSLIAGKTRKEAVIEKIAESTMGLVAVNESNVTMLVYNSFTDVGKSEPYTDDSPANGQYDMGEIYTDANGNGQWDMDLGVPGLGDACDIVVYRVNAEWPLMLGLIASATGAKIRITASTAVRNEPYNYQPC